jgi:hypothetical protein
MLSPSCDVDMGPGCREARVTQKKGMPWEETEEEEWEEIKMERIGCQMIRLK